MQISSFSLLHTPDLENTLLAKGLPIQNRLRQNSGSWDGVGAEEPAHGSALTHHTAAGLGTSASALDSAGTSAVEMWSAATSSWPSGVSSMCYWDKPWEEPWKQTPRENRSLNLSDTCSSFYSHVCLLPKASAFQFLATLPVVVTVCGLTFSVRNSPEASLSNEEPMASPAALTYFLHILREEVMRGTKQLGFTFSHNSDLLEWKLSSASTLGGWAERNGDFTKAEVKLSDLGEICSGFSSQAGCACTRTLSQTAQHNLTQQVWKLVQGAWRIRKLCQGRATETPPQPFFPVRPHRA